MRQNVSSPKRILIGPVTRRLEVLTDYYQRTGLTAVGVCGGTRLYWSGRCCEVAAATRPQGTNMTRIKFGQNSAFDIWPYVLVPRSVSGGRCDNNSYIKLNCDKTFRLIWDNGISLGIRSSTPCTPSIPVGGHDRLVVWLHRRRRGLSAQSKLQQLTDLESHHNEEFSITGRPLLVFGISPFLVGT